MNHNYFIESMPNIDSNSELREPQILAYQAIQEHFVQNKSDEHAVVVLPTGVGKTGLMGIAPFGISFGRVLIVTPQLVIKDAVLDSLDPDHPQNFWLTRGVFSKYEELPAVIEYDSKTSEWELNQADIVILNIHKLQERLDNALINRVSHDFFGMVIIDEAHHSTAPTWERTLEYFSAAKVVKVTGTPTRSDGEEIKGKFVYKYPLSQAMASGYVKSLERIHYVPDKLYLTLDKKDGTVYSVEQIRDMNLKDEDWITRSVAYSKECSLKVVQESVAILNEKRSTGVPHKIIAVACSIWHAEQLEELYRGLGQEVALVHSKLKKDDLDTRLKAIENHKVQVVIHVAKLGEGYDHKYLSVAAIFRPFRHTLPYEQFVGRVLRAIDKEEAVTEEDNIACVVHHKELGLEDLWKFYKEEKEKSDVIKFIDREGESFERLTPTKIDKMTGEVFEDAGGKLERDSFINTELLLERERRLKEENEKINRLREILPTVPEEALRQMVRREEEGTAAAKILRPDKFITRKKRNLDDIIKKEMVPEVILDYNVSKEGTELGDSKLFSGRSYKWIPQRIRNNAGMIAAYLEFRVNELVGNSNRNTWGPEEYEAALGHVDDLYEHLRRVLDSEFRKEG
ncbi:DEAD/DEAH box helicase [Paenibacillus caseinilyticus]|uniref:Type III restriction endonuclease subunit R n=1 Tax=Paenibacillus mucilaginosus K02 TaxID=997761 RepID=I0BDZ9_9BACL|nr:DEAD/DEAH box helicase family protein [Paenibacillus mucilaginosus]AFH60596.1 type III restriction endonuclease subunit R [Paenibacillus mucilaginosus K02]